MGGSITSHDWDFGDGNSGSGATASHTYGAAGTYSVVLTVTDNEGATDTDQQNVTVSDVLPPPSGTAMHVGDLDGAGKIKGRSGKWEVSVTVAVHGDDHGEVANAGITGQWGGGASGTVSGSTSSDGTITFTTGNMSSGTSVTLTVNSVTHGTLAYDAGANHDPDKP